MLGSWREWKRPLTRARYERSKPAVRMYWAAVSGLAALALCLIAPIGSRAAAQVADLVFVGGTIISVDPRQPEPEALAVRDGLIAAVGSRGEVLALRGPDTRLIDLEGRSLLPGFIDAHGHLLNVAQVLLTANLASPPVGPVEDIVGLREVLERYRAERDLQPGEWIIGVGYDDSLLAERRHPTRSDLDDLFPRNPVVLLHVSGHLAVANSRALALAGSGLRGFGLRRHRWASSAALLARR